jgi:hypothetical protein
MNNTRIRYLNTNPLKSVRVFTVGDKALRVSLTDNLKYVITDENTGTVVAEGGKTKNLAVLKIQAKNALKSLGVDFGEEKRDRSDNTNS